MRLLVQALATAHPEVPPRAGATEVFGLSGLGLFRGLGKTLLPVFAFLALLTIIAGCVLLIGCANVAALLISRAVARRREIAVRLALGAGRGRVVRQLLAESAVLAIAAGLAGVLLAAWLVALMPALISRLPVQLDLGVAIDRRVLAYAVVLIAATALLFGLTPARHASRTDILQRTQEREQLARPASVETRTGHRPGVPVFVAARLEPVVRAKLAERVASEPGIRLVWAYCSRACHSMPARRWTAGRRSSRMFSVALRRCRASSQSGWSSRFHSR